MEIYVEKRNPLSDLGGLCECFVSETENAHPLAAPHVHRHFELLYCLSGSYELVADGRTFVLKKGDVALVHPMEPHQTRTLEEGKNAYLVLKFTPEALYSVSQPIFELKYIFPYLHLNDRKAYVYTAKQLEDSRLEDLLYRILEERREEKYGYEMAVRAYVCQVLLWFLRAWNRTRETPSVDDRSLMRLNRAIQYIDEHLEEELRAQDVADFLGMGQSTFSRFFAATAGMSLPVFIRTRRLGRAAALLAHTDRSITDIAAETGFTTASYLILCFRNQYGITPARFRKLYATAQE